MSAAFAVACSSVVPTLPMSVLLVCAHPSEGERVLDAHPDTVVTGVGKVAAAIAVTQALARARSLARKPSAVLAFGLCGAYPQRHVARGVNFLRVLDGCVVGDDVLADDGVETPQGYQDMEALGFGRVGPFTTDAELVRRVADGLGLPVVRGATVSTCSGSEARSDAVAHRTGAQVETMEGAAIAAVCRQFAVPWVQLRVVSNDTGDRDRAGWQREDACARVQDLVLKLMARRWAE